MTYKYILKLKITYRLFVIVNILTQLINIAILLVKISDRRFWNSACVSFSNKFIPQKRSAPLRVHKKPFWRWLSSWCKIQKVARRKVKLRFPNTLWTVVLDSWPLGQIDQLDWPDPPRKPAKSVYARVVLLTDRDDVIHRYVKHWSWDILRLYLCTRPKVGNLCSKVVIFCKLMILLASQAWIQAGLLLKPAVKASRERYMLPLVVVLPILGT